MRKFLFSILAAGTLMFAAAGCDDGVPEDWGDGPVQDPNENPKDDPKDDPNDTDDPTPDENAAAIHFYSAIYDSAKDEWKKDEEGTHFIFNEEASDAVTLIWNQWDERFEAYVKYEIENYEGEFTVDAPEWLEYLELNSDTNLLMLTATTVELEGAEGAMTFTGADDVELGELTVKVLETTAPFEVVFRSSDVDNMKVLNFDFDGKFNMGTVESPVWSEAMAVGSLTAAVDGEAVPTAYVLTKTGENALSADNVDWVHVEVANAVRSTLGQMTVKVTVDENKGDAREAYLVFVPFNAEAKSAADVLSGTWVKGDYANCPQFPISQNEWREITAFEFKDGYCDSFQSLSTFEPEGVEVWGDCQNYYQLTYTEYNKIIEGEIDYPTSVNVNFDFAKFEVYDSAASTGTAYYTWTPEGESGQFNWLYVHQAASSNPYMWQIAMTGKSTLNELYSVYDGYVVFYKNASDTTPYAVLKCTFDGEIEEPESTFDVSLFSPAGAWAVEKLEAGNELYKTYSESLTTSDGVIYLVHYEGKLADMPKNVKLAGVPASNKEYGDIIMTWLTGDATTVHEKSCEWVLHEGDEQEFGYPNVETGYVEFEVNLDDIDTSKGYSYAVSQHMNSNLQCDMLIIVEMLWDEEDTTSGVTLYEPAGAWKVEEAGVQLYDYLKESLDAKDGVIYLVHYEGKLADMPTNVKLAGVPVSNDWGDVKVEFYGDRGDDIFYGGLCEWVLHEGEEQEFGYPQESTGYVEFKVDTEKVAEIAAEKAAKEEDFYALGYHVNSSTQSDILFVIEFRLE